MYETIIFVLPLILTLVVSILFFKRINYAYKKYIEAKNAVDDIIISFNRQLKQHKDGIDTIVLELNSLSRQHESNIKKIEEKELSLIKEKSTIPEQNQRIINMIDKFEQNLKELESANDSHSKDIKNLKKLLTREIKIEPKIKAVIPIKREKALAPLTETELTVLEFLASEGEKTTPQIRFQIKLSREHTSRLMKKLYEDGYLERITNRIPFRYQIKDEMRRILEKPQ